jgi:hypothetical protein
MTKRNFSVRLDDTDRRLAELGATSDGTSVGGFIRTAIREAVKARIIDPRLGSPIPNWQLRGRLWSKQRKRSEP